MKELAQKLREFAAKRDWEQFHSPKNLSMALSVEVAEIVELFQWLTEEESYKLPPDKLDKTKEEIGDVVIYLYVFRGHKAKAKRLKLLQIWAARNRLK